LDFARLDAGSIKLKKEAFDLRQLVFDIMRDFELQKKASQVELLSEYQPDMPQHVLGDPHRVRQIIDNLVSNALKFTQAGHIKLKIENLAEKEHIISVKLTVEDTGTGIPEDKLSVIFDRFKQLDMARSGFKQGVGLGLAIVKQLVELMQGKIGVKSHVGQGSIFWCTMNLQKVEKYKFTKSILTAPNDSMPKKTIEKPMPKKAYHVLLVEDSLVNQKVMKLFLEEINCQVDIAGTGQAALKLIKPEHELVLMDVSLPDLNGFETTQAIRKQAIYKDLPIIAITAHVFDKDKQKCLDSGMNDVINKPVSKEQLIKILQKYISK
ncbi:MAG: ATP-binding protein, partial [Pseudomonadota bacterium]